MTDASARDNPDRALLERLATGGALPATFDTNPLALSLQGKIVELDRITGLVVMTFVPQSLHLQGTGVVQGGIIATLLDFGLALSALARLEAGWSVATLSLTTNFARGAQPRELRVRAQLDRIGRTAAFASARCEQAVNGQDTLVANATATMAVIDLRGAR